MNYELLNEKVTTSNVKLKALKEAIGCSYYTLSNKLTGKSEMTVNEMRIISNVLNLSRSERIAIFFANDVHKMQTNNYECAR